MRNTKIILGLTEAQVDDIFTLAIYYHCDLRYAGKLAQRRLVKQGVGPFDFPKEDRDAEYSSWAYGKYKEIVKAHVSERWPDRWQWTHDYWGAEGLWFEPGWDAPKGGGYYVGSACFDLAWFSSFEALAQYTERSLSEEGIADSGRKSA